jgi:hypothetical protein
MLQNFKFYGHSCSASVHPNAPNVILVGDKRPYDAPTEAAAKGSRVIRCVYCCKSPQLHNVLLDDGFCSSVFCRSDCGSDLVYSRTISPLRAAFTAGENKAHTTSGWPEPDGTGSCPGTSAVNDLFARSTTCRNLTLPGLHF